MEEKNLTGFPSIDKPWEKGKTFFQRHPIIPPVNIYTLIKLINRKNRDKPAVTCHENSYTYGQMLKDSARLAHALTLNKVRHGDIVAVCLPNIYEAVIAFLACNKIGAIFTCLNANASASEIQSYLQTYHSPILFTHRTDIVDSVLAQTEIRKIVLFEETPDTGNERVTAYSDFIQQGSEKWRGGIMFNGKDDALILYTSGTTGKPKSVVLTNENVISSILFYVNTATETKIEGTKTLTCVPFSYPYGLVTSLITSLLWEKESVLAPYIGIDTAAYYFSFKPNIIFGSPALLSVIMHSIPDEFDLSCVTVFVSGGDFLPISQAQKGHEFFLKHGSTVEISNGFGNAETVSCGTTNVGVKRNANTVGKVYAGMKVMIVDPVTFEEKKYGEEGLLLASGKHVFREYYGEPEQTKAAKRVIRGREYFITGTMGYLDENGYFTLTGRQSRFYINASLNKIYLDHVQKIIDDLDCVEACAVVKVPDEKELFVNKAYIVLKDGYTPSEEMKQTILQALKAPKMDEDSETLKSHEIPTYMEFLDRLPLMEGSEKVNYRALEERAAKE